MAQRFKNGKPIVEINDTRLKELQENIHIRSIELGEMFSKIEYLNKELSKKQKERDEIIDIKKTIETFNIERLKKEEKGKEEFEITRNIRNKELQDIEIRINIQEHILIKTEESIARFKKELEELKKIIKDRQKENDILVNKKDKLVKEIEILNQELYTISERTKEDKKYSDNVQELRKAMDTEVDAIEDREKRCGVRERSLIRKYKKLFNLDIII